jgi:glycosyltransferase involved in cell wall biosynthesis
VRIGLDFQFLATHSAIRGTGRYTQLQLREVMRRDPGSTYVLIMRPDADLRRLDREVAAASNVERVVLPKHLWLHGLLANQPEMYMRCAAAFERFVLDLDLDVLHRTGSVDLAVPLTRVPSVPTVSTHYDLIPLVYTDSYLDEFWAGVYRRNVGVASESDRLIAISRFVRDEAVRRLGFPADRIDVAYPFADPRFRPLPGAEVVRLLAALRRRAGIPERYLLNVGALHFAKNTPGLLRGYARLPPSLRRECPLVLAFDIPPQDKPRLSAHLAATGLSPDDVLTTGFVSDEELAALYNGSVFYVHPSRYEGFGVPVLEALQCGKAVVASRASALPEVVGDAGLLVDPDEPEELARAMLRLLQDARLRESLEERAIVRAARFTPEALAEPTRRAYDRAVARFRSRARRPRLALWTPLPPLPSGVSDYSVELLDALCVWADVEVFVAGGYEPDADLLRRFTVREASSFSAVMAHRGYDFILYQLGASSFHRFEERAVERWPGILTLHDLTWGRVLADEAIRRRRFPEFCRRLLEEEGEAALREFDAIDTSSEEPWGELDRVFRDRFLLGRFVASSLAQIVHLPGAATELSARYAAARPVFFPMGVADPWQRVTTKDSGELRRRCGFGDDEFVLGAFGIAHPVKRLERGIQAVAELRAQAIPSRFVIVGRFLPPSYRGELTDLARRLSVEDYVSILGHVPDDRFAELLCGVDAVLNLRFPFPWQMSAVLMRALAAGKPVLVTELAAWDFLPSGFCLTVRPDDHELDRIVTELRHLALDPGRRAALGGEARLWYLENATPDRMASHYRDVLTRVGPGLARTA